MSKRTPRIDDDPEAFDALAQKTAKMLASGNAYDGQERFSAECKRLNLHGRDISVLRARVWVHYKDLRKQK